MNCPRDVCGVRGTGIIFTVHVVYLSLYVCHVSILISNFDRGLVGLRWSTKGIISRFDEEKLPSSSEVSYAEIEPRRTKIL